LILTDVTLRDGLQAETKVVSLEHKLKALELLSLCQFDRLEITSFVNPKWIPQLSDSEKLCESWFKKKTNQETMAFVPNAKGCQRLVQFPIPWVSCFVAASSAFNQKNVNATIDETLKEVEAIIEIAKGAKRKVRLYISTVWGCPYEGEISNQKLEALLKKVAQLDLSEVALSDTLGVATPHKVKSVLKMSTAYIPVEKTALHLHNTYGFALANIQTGFEEGVRSFDGSMGGLGGCPYAKGATGNVASDDIKNFFFRENRLSSFPKQQMEEVLKFLSNPVGLSLNSSLAKILEKGGSWYGIQ
jgi:hydroxymethylglutaryl-CoA lyase